MTRAKAPLERYNKKRSFDKTPEPKGERAESGSIYVVQKHDATRLHYDFRLEHNGVLLSWAVPKEPSTNPRIKRLAVHVEDHPVSYATFAGTIPEGNYGAGTVEIWDRGTWSPEQDVDKALKEGELKFALHGERLNGRWVLVRMGPASEKENWLLIKERSDEAESKPLPKPLEWKDESLRHQLCELRTALPPGEGWRYELKWDGYRAFAIVENGLARLLSRNGNDLGQSDLAASIAAAVTGNVILDGEIIAQNEEGRSDFSLLQSLLDSKSSRIRFVAFDILKVGNQDVRRLSLAKRLELLAHVCDLKKSKRLMLSPPLEGDSSAVLATACQVGFEGIVAKKLDSPYSGSRSSDWIKVKCRRQGTGPIIGFTHLADSPNAIGALLVGEKRDGKLSYLGRVGTGLSHPEREQLFARLSLLRQTKMDIADVSAEQSKGVIWVKPEVEIRFEFAEKTNSGVLRQASFMGEVGKKMKESKVELPVQPAETPKPSAVRLTHPERVIDPQSGGTKLNVFDYYRDFGHLMLPYLKDRLVAMVRCPDGVSGDCFFQKHLMAGKYKGVKEIVDGDDKFVTIRSVTGLLESCQMGVLEFHPWGSKIKQIDRPDMIIFDLDPSEKVEWSQILEAASYVRNRLQTIGFEPFVKLSGGKGVHLVLSIKPELEWPAVKAFCRAFAEQMATERPNLFVSTASKEKRQGKIYIDYLRNGRGATAVAPYCLRSRPGLPIAMPMTWEEVMASTSSSQVTLANVQEYLSKRTEDPWEEFSRAAISIKRAIQL